MKLIEKTRGIRLFIKKNMQKLLLFLAVLGPGLITAFADNDAAGVATYSVSASKFGYSILTILIPITIVLAVTQEIGARLAVVTGKGLGDLIRERYGIGVSIFMFFLAFVVNLVVIVQNISGVRAALTLFKINYQIFLPIIFALLFIFIVRSSYKIVERFFLLLIFFYGTYFFSAILAKPDWGIAFKSLFIPQGNINFEYLFTSIAVLGTTVTLWGQFFINSSIKDKKITSSKLIYVQTEVYIGAFLTDLFTLFMMVAVIATLYKHGIVIHGAAEASLAIKPFAGEMASILFGYGLLIAGILGCLIVPLSTAYAFAEFFGYEGSLDTDFKKSRLFYGLFLFQIILGLIIVFFPQISLFKITLFANFINGLILPVLFYFLYRFANDEELLRNQVNNSLQNILLVGSGLLITLGGVAGVLGAFFKW
jgi:Mn2+/Fe2+ NRAMP family transporter